MNIQHSSVYSSREICIRLSHRPTYIENIISKGNMINEYINKIICRPIYNLYTCNNLSFISTFDSRFTFETFFKFYIALHLFPCRFIFL